MAHATDKESEPTLIHLFVDPTLHRNLELAAAAHDQTVGQYVLDAVQDRLRQEREGAGGADAVIAAADPVLTELWDNPRDAEYDAL